MARNNSTRRDGSTFDESTIESVWRKGEIEPNYSNFRKDKCGASMQRDKYGKTEGWGWEIDHIKPVALGGTDDMNNLQPLQWENNRYKGDNYPNWNCKIRR
ncbi:MAG: HNH endonuclease signature motif containing protein [Candidatus Moranbacteria bacterium]|nr:HNH endonuclease signature motif containing protein [Candidatus Moranbacteria bacterium]